MSITNCTESRLVKLFFVANLHPSQQVSDDLSFEDDVEEEGEVEDVEEEEEVEAEAGPSERKRRREGEHVEFTPQQFTLIEKMFEKMFEKMSEKMNKILEQNGSKMNNQQQSCEISQIRQIYMCKNFEGRGKFLHTEVG